ncbi:MAG: response regulator transcription factor [Actinobacteria bacterium]|nr:response regulator transcription factor [Actinomycetota bacterium]
MTNVVVIVAHSVERDGTVKLLTMDPRIHVVGRAENVESAMLDIRRKHPEVVLVEFHLPGISGAQAIIKIREAQPTARVVVLSEYDTEPIMLAAFGAGAKGFVVKQSSPSLLRHAVHATAGGGTYVDPLLARKLVELATKGKRAKGPHGLTLQQMRVLEHLARGMTNRQIAEQLGLGTETVKSHVRAIMTKLDIRGRAKLAAEAKKRGLA